MGSDDCGHAKCLNCGGEHMADDPKCPERKRRTGLPTTTANSATSSESKGKARATKQPAAKTNATPNAPEESTSAPKKGRKPKGITARAVAEVREAHEHLSEKEAEDLLREVDGSVVMAVKKAALQQAMRRGGTRSPEAGRTR